MQHSLGSNPINGPHRRILQSCLSRSWGGLEMVALENALSMTAHGAQCYTLCFAGSPLEAHLRKRGQPTLTLERRRLFDFLSVRHFLQEYKIDTILVQHLKDLLLFSLATMSLTSIKIFAISHTLVNVNKKDLIHRWSYRKIDKLICLTNTHKANLLEHLPLNEPQLEIIPNFIDCEHFNPQNRSQAVRQSLGAPQGVPLMGVASRLDPQKGQDTALQALALLKKKNVPLHLVVVGENTKNEVNYLEVLKNLARELDIEDRVTFTGYRADMENIMASLDGMVMPSHCETFGRVLLEAMASKTAVIATRAGGVLDIINSGYDGLLVPPKDPTALAQAMEKIATDTQLRQQLAESGYFKVRTTYAKNVVEKKLLDLLGI